MTSYVGKLTKALPQKSIEGNNDLLFSSCDFVDRSLLKKNNDDER
jgi:hypothetical protein